MRHSTRACQRFGARVPKLLPSELWCAAPMELDDALNLFPPDSPYRSLLRGLMANSYEQRGDALRKLREHRPVVPYWVEAEPMEESTALAVLRSVVELQFPPQQHDWENRQQDLIFIIIGSAYPSLIDYVEATRITGRR